MKPLRAVLVGNDTETRQFGPFVGDNRVAIPNAAIFETVTGNAFYAIRFDYYEPPIESVTVTLSSPFTPSGGDLGWPIPVLEDE